MMADIIYAGEKAVFGQPEIKLGVIPGAGGTQRLPLLIGKTRAAELILTGRNFSAQEAEKWGLVARIFPVDKVVDEAIKTASEIAQYSPLAVKAAKEAINEGYQGGLDQGLRYERRVFHGLFGSQDQKEGMAAFAEKRKAKFTGK
jgi:enoyl-CoA hydratase